MKFSVSGFAAAAILMAVSASPASAAPDKTLTVEVFQICADDGSNCASLGPEDNNYFASQTNAIWAQAGISVGFHFNSKIEDSNFLYINDFVDGRDFATLSYMYGAHGLSNTVVPMFLAHTIEGSYGEGWPGYGGIVIGMDDVMSYNNNVGRIDNIAHELGHNFGLIKDDDPFWNGSGHSIAPNQLMASGLYRLIPGSASDIAPNGAGLDLLTPFQIAEARQSSLLQDVSPVPEPGEWAMMGAGLMLVGAIARRRGAVAA